MKKIIIIGILAIFACAASAAPQTIVHRKNVSEKDASGWYPASSTTGGFAVLMPLPFADYSVVGDNVDGGRFEMSFIAARSTDGFQFTASSVSCSAKQPDLRSLYEKFRKDGQVLSEATVQKSDTEETMTFEVTQRSSKAWLRYVIRDKKLITLIVECPSDKENIIKDHVPTFFASLRTQTAQPGATDNPDDAQRLRGDH